MSANNFMTITKTTNYKTGTYYTLKLLDADTKKVTEKIKCKSLEEAIKFANAEMPDVEYGLRRVEV